MDQKKKASLLDFITIAVPGILTLFAGIVFSLLGAQGPKGWPLATSAVGLAFLGIWLRVFLLRRKSG